MKAVVKTGFFCLFYVLCLVWQLPQVLLGLVSVLVFKAKFCGSVYLFGLFRVDVFYFIPSKWRPRSAFSLGPIVVASKEFCGFGIRFGQKGADLTGLTIRHELGHSKQSIFLGPLYTLIIGIPSRLFYTISKRNMEFRKRYYKRFPENWADRLSGIVRD